MIRMFSELVKTRPEDLGCKARFLIIGVGYRRTLASMADEYFGGIIEQTVFEADVSGGSGETCTHESVQW